MNANTLDMTKLADKEISEALSHCADDFASCEDCILNQKIGKRGMFSEVCRLNLMAEASNRIYNLLK